MSATQERIETLDERVARLAERLQDGFQKIGEAMNRGVEVQNWERHWVELLREYENIEDELDAHHAEVRQQAELAGMPRRGGGGLARRTGRW